jgi:hypothetical protein
MFNVINLTSSGQAVSPEVTNPPAAKAGGFTSN